MNPRKKSTREEFERALAQCKPEDFDGHTEFHRLTPEQRLEWLCEAASAQITIHQNWCSGPRNDGGYVHVEK